MNLTIDTKKIRDRLAFECGVIEVSFHKHYFLARCEVPSRNDAIITRAYVTDDLLANSAGGAYLEKCIASELNFAMFGEQPGYDKWLPKEAARLAEAREK